MGHGILEIAFCAGSGFDGGLFDGLLAQLGVSGERGDVLTEYHIVEYQNLSLTYSWDMIGRWELRTYNLMRQSVLAWTITAQHTSAAGKITPYEEE